jgi:hypothetical protein
MTTAISEETEAKDFTSKTNDGQIKLIAVALSYEYAMGRNEALEPDGAAVIRNKVGNRERAKYIAEGLWDSPERLQAATNLLTDLSSPYDTRLENNLRSLHLGQPSAPGP